MGNYVSLSLQTVYDTWARLFANVEKRVLILGLDAAGKTTLLYRIKLDECVSTIPTMGFNIESFNHGNITFTAWDIAGQRQLRPLYRHYFSNTDAVIFVVDSADHERILEAKEELYFVFEHEHLEDAKLLVYANKQDHPMAMTPEQVSEALELQKATKNPSKVQGSIASTGEGLVEGLEWLSKVLIEVNAA